MESLTRLPNGKIDHQRGSSKDRSDAWAGSVRGAIKLAESGGGINDGWSGGSLEEAARVEATAAVAARNGWMMSPASREDVIDEELSTRMELDRAFEMFDSAVFDARPSRSSDQPL